MTDWWESAFQTSIDAYYQGDFDRGLSACEQLLSVDGLPSEIDAQVHRNLAFYAPKLDTLISPTRSIPIRIPVHDGWSSFNPSIASNEVGFKMIVRSSNYQYDGHVMAMAVNDANTIIRTRNHLLTLDHDLNIRAVETIVDGEFQSAEPSFPVTGFEDCRIFARCGSWWATATVRDRGDQGICQTALLQLDGATLTGLELLSDGRDQHEKNWMPTVESNGGTLRFIYSCFPTVILRYDDETKRVAEEVSWSAPLVARRFSGGTQVIPIDGGHLCLIHEAARFEDGHRLYTHRWVWFDADWRLSRISPPFIFQELGVEFAIGLAQRGDDLVISYGLWDREAWLATVPVDQVRSLLAPPIPSHEAEEQVQAGARTLIAVAAGADQRPEPAAETSHHPARTAEATRESIPPFPARSPSIVSMTLARNNRELIGDALRSVVTWVDLCLVIDTGVTDDSLEIAQEIAGAKLVVRYCPWLDDFGAARNFALRIAAQLGADWAVTLDTDERIDLKGIDIRTILSTATAEVLSVMHVSGTYGKERFFRLPARGRYVGPTHEAFIGQTGCELLPGITFDEINKTPEAYMQKAERDVAILGRYTAEHPNDPRWFYYLGDSLAGLRRDDEAIAAFRACANLNGWDEEGAWAMYRAAECLLKLDRPEDAIEACAVGMGRHAGLAELQWLAAYACWQADRPEQAIYWARHAIGMGRFAGRGASVPRVGFRHPPALWEGPYDVLRFALRRVGDDTGADEAEELFREAKAARERDNGLS